MSTKKTDMSLLINADAVQNPKIVETVVTDFSESKQFSVRVDMKRYNLVRQAAFQHNKSHKDLITEAIDLWLKANNYM